MHLLSIDIWKIRWTPTNLEERSNSWETSPIHFTTLEGPIYWVLSFSFIPNLMHFKLEFSLLHIYIRFLTTLSGFQSLTDLLNFLHGFKNVIFPNQSRFTNFEQDYRWPTSILIQCFKRSHLNTSMITIAIGKLNLGYKSSKFTLKTITQDLNMSSNILIICLA